MRLYGYCVLLVVSLLVHHRAWIAQFFAEEQQLIQLSRWSAYLDHIVLDDRLRSDLVCVYGSEDEIKGSNPKSVI